MMMSAVVEGQRKIDIDRLNQDIALFAQAHAITQDRSNNNKSVSRLVMLNRYTFKDTEKKTVKEGDFVVLTVKADPKFPARRYGFIKTIDWSKNEAQVEVDPQFVSVLDTEEEVQTGIIKRSLDVVEDRKSVV